MDNEEEPRVVAMVWRNDGVIEYIIPPAIAVNTFISLAAQHSSWLCFFMEDMASVLRSTDMDAEVAERYHVDLDSFREAIFKAHGTLEHENPRMKRGSEDFLPGTFYGTMHPAELAALANDLETILAMFSITGQTDTGKDMIRSWGLWIKAAQKYTRPSEQMASVSTGTIKE